MRNRPHRNLARPSLRAGIAAGLSALLVTSAMGADDLETAKRAKRRALRDGPATIPSGDPESERRDALERHGVRPTLRPRSVIGAFGAARNAQTSVATYDWSARHRRAGAIRDDLQLALSDPEPEYAPATTHFLYLSLRNQRLAPRSLEAMPGLGRLALSGGLQFHVVADDGRAIFVENPFEAHEAQGTRRPLQIEAASTLFDVIDLSQLMATSPAFFDLVHSAGRIEIRASVPGLGLQSNPVTLRVVAP